MDNAGLRIVALIVVESMLHSPALQPSPTAGAPFRPPRLTVGRRSVEAAATSLCAYVLTWRARMTN